MAPLLGRNLVYSRHKHEINHVSTAYFTDIIINYYFGERRKVFHAILAKFLRLLAADLTVADQISSIVAALLSFLTY